MCTHPPLGRCNVLRRRGKTNIYSVSGCSREEFPASLAAIYIPARRAATRRLLNPKSHNTRIGAMEIAGLYVQISMSGHPVLKMWHPFNSTYGSTWSRPVADKTGNITVHHGRCCSHMEQPWNHTEDNTCRFKMSLLVHSQCRRSLRTANSRSTHVLLCHNVCQTWLCYYVTAEIASHVDTTFFTWNKTMNNQAKSGRYVIRYSDRSDQLIKSPESNK